MGLVMIASFLNDIELAHCVRPLHDHGIDNLHDLEDALRKSLEDQAAILRETGILPREWIQIRRAYSTLHEWCQQSYAQDMTTEFTLLILL